MHYASARHLSMRILNEIYCKNPQLAIRMTFTDIC